MSQADWASMTPEERVMTAQLEAMAWEARQAQDTQQTALQKIGD